MAVLFFAACVACLTVGPQVHPMAAAAGKLQIVLSSAGATAGVALVWLGLTFLFGRLYCASVCPVGVFSDIFVRLRRVIPGTNRPFSYRHRPGVSVHFLWIYVVCVVIGVSTVPFLVEPWNIARNMAATVNPQAVAGTWLTIGHSALFGAAAGVASAILLAALAVWRGRVFCTTFCPVGTALGYVQNHALYHIEINPDKCTSCGKCEDICRSQCIKVVSRYVDQQRCVRCFDCVAECPDDAIRFQINRNRPAMPLMRKAKVK